LDLQVELHLVSLRNTEDSQTLLHSASILFEVLLRTLVSEADLSIKAFALLAAIRKLTICDFATLLTGSHT